MNNPFKSMKLAKRLRSIFPKSDQLIDTDIYKKYRILGDAIHMDAGMVLLFWVSMIATGVMFIVSVTTNNPLYFVLTAVFLVLVIIWLVVFGRNQREDALQEAYFAGEAINLIRQEASLERCELTLHKLAVNQLFAERGMGGVLKRERLRFDVHLAIFRAAGYKLGQREKYFDGK